jgi:ABC-type uncharacterized transport system involved in gliding motility auxiliary subunit
MKEHRSTLRRQRAILGALLAADLILAAAVTARFFVRIDLSRNSMYTLSAATKTMVAGLQEPLRITYYVSEKLRSRYPFPQAVEDLLNEYAAASRGRVSVSSVDPARAKSPVRPEQLGLVAQQMQVVEREESTVATVYSGIVVQYLDRTEALAFVSDIATLEYDLSSRIRAAVTGSARVVGVLLGDLQKQPDQDYRYLDQELAQRFQVRLVEKGKPVPPDLSVLLVIGTRDLEAADMLAVDQFVMRGGRALIATDSVDVGLAGGLAASVTPNKAPAEALAAWGVKVRDELVLDRVNQRISFRVQQNQYMVVNYPYWVTASSRSVARDNPLTSRFAGLDLFWPCVIEIQAPAGVSAEAIVSSSPDAWSAKAPFETNPALAQILEQQAGERRRFPLVVSLSGEFPSAFAGKPVPPRSGEPAPAGPLLARSPRTRLLVVADADFATDLVQYTQAGYNMSFISNAVEWLAMEDDLLSIKTRAQADTRLSRIQEPLARARAMRASQVVNVAVVPLLVVAAGVARLLFRRKKKREAPAEKRGDGEGRL